MRNNNLKKCICIIIALISVLGLASCGKEDDVQYNSVEELNGKSIVVMLGTTNSTAVAAYEPLSDAELLYVPTNADALAMLLQKNADAFALDNATAQTLKLRYRGLSVIDGDIDKTGYGFALQQGSELKSIFDVLIDKYYRDGTMQALQEKWFGEDTAKTVPSQRWEGKSGTITCRVNADFEPFCYKDKFGNIIGYDIDLLLKMAKELDLKVEFSEGEFSDLLPALSAGHIDMVAGGISITQDRLQHVDFTEEYFETSTVLLVRDVDFDTETEGLILSLQNGFRRVFLEEGRGKRFLDSIVMSLKIIFISLITSSIFGFAMYLWCYTGSKIGNAVIKTINFIQTYMPFSVWILFVYYVLLGGNSVDSFTAAIIAFTIGVGRDVYMQLNSAIGSVDKGQIDAAMSMGYARFSALFNVFFPQAIPQFLGGMKGAIIGLIRVSSLVEFIGVLDVQTVSDAIRAETFEQMFPIVFAAVFYISFSYIATKIIDLVINLIVRPEKTEEQIMQNIMKGKL